MACGFENNSELALYAEHVITYLLNGSSSISKQKSITNIVCNHLVFNEFKLYMNYIDAILMIIFAILGIVGSASILITIVKNQNFDAICFYVFRIVAVLEIFYSIFKFSVAYSWLNADERAKSLVWFYIITVGNAICGQLLSRIILYSVIFLSIERTVATLLPTKFHLIDRKRVFVGVFLFIFTLACVFDVPRAFQSKPELESGSGKYFTVDTDFGKSYTFTT
jgi:hypothetical protein